MPPELVGRQDVLHSFDVIVQRAAQGRTDKGIIATGLRGVGKTVLLGAFGDIAHRHGAVVINHEASKGTGNFTETFPTLARRALLSISPRDRWLDRTRRAAGILKGFKGQFDPAGGWSVGVDIDAVEGVGDSGQLLLDLPELVSAIGAAAAEHNTVVVFLIDEVQYLSSAELSALVMAKHQVNRDAVPVVLAGAGLPQLPAVTGAAQTYAERMFHWPWIGSLEPDDAVQALVGPARDEGVGFASGAAERIAELTEGYPYFIQEYGQAVWDLAEASPITLGDVQRAQDRVEAALDQDFFAVRVGALPENELRYVHALASLGPGEHPVAVVASAMGERTSTTVGSYGTRLRDRGLIYHPRRGFVSFTVPQFDQYVLRSMGHT